jgi:amidohydrolase
MNIVKQAKEREERLIQFRRDLHRIPEIAYQEEKTSAYITSVLKQHDISWKKLAGTGVVVTFGKGDSDAVLFRADFDALPVEEKTGLPFSSEHKGMMHACGHDSHAAILLEYALWLKENESMLTRPVKLVFQPAEEGEGGAKVMIDEGAMESPSVSEVYALHISNRLPTGSIGVKPGIAMAYIDEFEMTIKGAGGHASKPHNCIEPVLIAAQMIVDSQAIVARGINAMHGAVLTFTTIHSGNVFNVIEDNCSLGGTIRARTKEDRDYIVKRLENKCRAYELDHGCSIEFNIIGTYPGGYNDKAACKKVENTAKEILGPDCIIEKCLGLGGEDFAFFLDKAPGCYFMLGSGTGMEKTGPAHSSTFDFDESALKNGLALFMSLAPTK